MQRSTIRLGLSLMVVVGFWTNRLPAQDIFVVPVTPYAPAYHPYSPPAFFSPPPPPPANHGLKQCLNKYGMHCTVDPFYPVCGNWRYEANFIFGSCRYWMGEGCAPIPGHGQKHGWR
jgi:hypothetical protein